jgi:glycosyltransferase involved in cell wall biosynthesis
MTKKIAYIHYPHNVNASRLETMAFSLNSVMSLAKMGFQVDLYLWENPSSNYQAIFPETVNIKYFKHPLLSLNSRLNIIRPVALQLQFKLKKHHYDCVFGLGQIGAYVGNLLAQSSQCPFIYINDEFPSCWGNDSYWAGYEQKIAQQAALIIVPDLQRYYHLCTELNLKEKSFSVLPNIPTVQFSCAQIDWHERLEIDRDCALFLHAGSVADWAQIPELLSSVPYWPLKTVLVIHSHSSEILKAYRKELSHLDTPGRVIWSSEPLSNEELNSLVAYCTGNFALYRNTNVNFEYIGFSSGKLMRSLACGSPVIASRFLSLRFIEDFQLGFLVQHPAEIPNAVQEILGDHSAYAKRCSDFCTSHASFEKAWEEFSAKLQPLIE